MTQVKMYLYELKGENVSFYKIISSFPLKYNPHAHIYFGPVREYYIWYTFQILINKNDFVC